MIPIFRRIRRQMADDNRPLKYMRYAIGEIVLVVIGIVIALQINNWNQNRIQLRNINNALVEIHSNLTRDYRSLDFSITLKNGFIDEIAQIELNGATMPIDSLIKKMSAIYRVVDWQPTVTGYNKLQQIKGDISLPDQLLTKLTQSYHFFAKPYADHRIDMLLLYSLNKYRDYMITKGFPLLSPSLKNEIKNKNKVRELMKDPEFIGILRNFQYNLDINFSGFSKAQTVVEHRITDIETYLDHENITYKKFEK